MKMQFGKLIHAGALLLRKHGPKILIIGGTIGLAASGVKACIDSTKAPDILEEHKEAADEIRNNSECEAGLTKEEQKALTKVYVKTGVKFLKLYGLALSGAALSITSILLGTYKFNKRNLALAATCMELGTGFKSYRDNVVARFGEEVDKELRHGIEKEVVEETIVDENGKKKKAKTTVEVVSKDMRNEFTRYFAKGEAKGWEPSEAYCESFLRAQQNAANTLLHLRKYIFLNEVLDMLGYEPTAAGQVVGWMIDETSEDRGDNHIDFGIRKILRRVEKVEGVESFETVWLLDFNCDGPILERATARGLLK